MHRTSAIAAVNLITLDARYLKIASNLSDLNNVATARTNLGLVSGGAGDIWVEKAGDTMTGPLINTQAAANDVVLGNEVVLNSTFVDGSNWGNAGNWTLSNGAVYNGGTPASDGITQTLTLEAATYVVKITNSGGVDPYYDVTIGTLVVSQRFFPFHTSPLDSSVFSFTATAGNHVLTIKPTSADTVTKITSFSVKKVITPSVAPYLINYSNGNPALEIRGTDPDTQNTCIGYNAGRYIKYGLKNVLIGYGVGQSLVSGAGNVLIGSSAGANIVSSTQLTVIGYNAGNALTTGGTNLFVGASAGAKITTGSMNCFIGGNAGGNTAVGVGSSVIIGAQSGTSMTGSSNIVIGNYAGYGALSNYNVIIGTSAGQNHTGTNNVLLGHYAAFNCTSGSGNVVIGYYAGTNVGSTTYSNKLYIHNAGANPLIEGNFSGALPGITINSQNTGMIPLVAKGIAGQTADYFEAQDSSANVLASISSASVLKLQNGSDYISINPSDGSGKPVITWFNATILAGTISVDASGFWMDTHLNFSGSSNINGVTSFQAVNITTKSATAPYFRVWKTGVSWFDIDGSTDNVLAFKNTSAVITNLTTAGLFTIGATPGTGKFNVLGTSDIVQSIVKGYSSQTADLQQWQKSDGGVLSYVNSSGQFYITSQAATDVPLTLKAWAAQTASLLIWRSAGGSQIGYISADGRISTSVALNQNDLTSIVGVAGITADKTSLSALSGSIVLGANTPALTKTGVLAPAAVIANLNMSSPLNIAEISNIRLSTTINTDGTITRLNGLVINSFNYVKGTVVNQYGLYIDDQNRGTTLNYAIYTNAGDVRFGDATSIIGSAAADVQFTVKGAASQTADIQVFQNSSGTILSGVNSAGHLFVGTAGSANYGVYVEKTFSDKEGGGLAFVVTQNTNWTAGYGVLGRCTTTAGNNEYLYGGYFDARAMQGSVNTIQKLVGVYGGIRDDTGYSASTVTNGYFFQGSIVRNGTVNYTNLYGLYLGDVSVGGTLNYAIYTNAGLVHFGDSLDLASGKSITLVAGDIVTDTTTGTKIGTATTQKLGFYNATPVTQQTGMAALKTDYVAGDLDTEAEIITALNNAHTEINKLRTALNALGLTTTV